MGEGIFVSASAISTNSALWSIKNRGRAHRQPVKRWHVGRVRHAACLAFTVLCCNPNGMGIEASLHARCAASSGDLGADMTAVRIKPRPANGLCCGLLFTAQRRAHGRIHRLRSERRRSGHGTRSPVPSLLQRKLVQSLQRNTRRHSSHSHKQKVGQQHAGAMMSNGCTRVSD
jgi:hypothetical protein